jgi:hypothetical protein
MTLANVAAVAESGGVRTLSGSDAADAFSGAAGSGDEASEAGWHPLIPTSSPTTAATMTKRAGRIMAGGV